MCGVGAGAGAGVGVGSSATGVGAGVTGVGCGNAAPTGVVGVGVGAEIGVGDDTGGAIAGSGGGGAGNDTLAVATGAELRGHSTPIIAPTVATIATASTITSGLRLVGAGGGRCARICVVGIGVGAGGE